MLCKAISRSPGVSGDTVELPSPETGDTEREREKAEEEGDNKTFQTTKKGGQQVVKILLAAGKRGTGFACRAINGTELMRGACA